jgi:hypothetical protein
MHIKAEQEDLYQNFEFHDPGVEVMPNLVYSVHYKTFLKKASSLILLIENSN